MFAKCCLRIRYSSLPVRILFKISLHILLNCIPWDGYLTCWNIYGLQYYLILSTKFQGTTSRFTLDFFNNIRGSMNSYVTWATYAKFHRIPCNFVQIQCNGILENVSHALKFHEIPWKSTKLSRSWNLINRIFQKSILLSIFLFVWYDDYVLFGEVIPEILNITLIS